MLRRREQNLLRSFGAAGEGCCIYTDGTFLNPSNIHVGSEVQIGPEAWFSAVEATITLGDKVTVGPRVAIITGDHNTSELRVFVHDVTVKRPKDDLPVTIEDDAWIGYGVTILKGVTVGRGGVIGAGAVVSRSIPAYAVAVGNPARVVRHLWDYESAVLHEGALYGRVISDLSHLAHAASSASTAEARPEPRQSE
jgi:acetyltransferase-like isoleucine patch superfamily enzyme